MMSIMISTTILSPSVFLSVESVETVGKWVASGSKRTFLCYHAIT